MRKKRHCPDPRGASRSGGSVLRIGINPIACARIRTLAPSTYRKTRLVGRDACGVLCYARPPHETDRHSHHHPKRSLPAAAASPEALAPALNMEYPFLSADLLLLSSLGGLMNAYRNMVLGVATGITTASLVSLLKSKYMLIGIGWCLVGLRVALRTGAKTSDTTTYYL